MAEARVRNSENVLQLEGVCGDWEEWQRRNHTEDIGDRDDEEFSETLSEYFSRTSKNSASTVVLEDDTDEKKGRDTEGWSVGN